MTIAGPEGLREWYVRSLETALPGSSAICQMFDLTLVEVRPGGLGGRGLTATPQRVVHGPPGNACFAYRVEIADRVLAYTGDTRVDQAYETARDGLETVID